MREDGPVEAGAADVTVPEAAVADHDVVAAFTVHSVGDGVAEENIVADNRVEPARVEVLTGTAVGHAEFEPVVALVTEDHLVSADAQDEVVAGAPKDSDSSSPVTMKSLPKPPRIRLMLLPPWMASLPSPPWMLSSPPRSG